MGKLLYYYATINLILYLAFYFQCINAGQCIRPLIYEKKSGKTDPTEYLASCEEFVAAVLCSLLIQIYFNNILLLKLLLWYTIVVNISRLF